MRRLTAPAVLVVVSALFLAYGRFTWSWVAGPVAALGVWALDRAANLPAQPSPGRRDREPAPVD